MKTKLVYQSWYQWCFNPTQTEGIGGGGKVTRGTTFIITIPNFIESIIGSEKGMSPIIIFRWLIESHSSQLEIEVFIFFLFLIFKILQK